MVLKLIRALGAAPLMAIGFSLAGTIQPAAGLNAAPQAVAAVCGGEQAAFLYKAISNAYGVQGDIAPHDNNPVCNPVAHTVFLKLDPGFLDWAEVGARQMPYSEKVSPFTEWQKYPILSGPYDRPDHSVAILGFSSYKIRYLNSGTAFDLDWYTSTGWIVLKNTGQMVANHGWAEMEVSRYGNDAAGDDHKNLKYMSNPTTQTYLPFDSLNCDGEILALSDWHTVKLSNTATFTVPGAPDPGGC